MSHRSLSRAAALSLTAALLISACSSSSDSNGAAGTSSLPATSPVAGETAAPDANPPDATTGAPAPTVGDICATIPSLDVINAQLDEPAVRTQRLDRGPGTELCEAASDGVANVQFSIVTDSSRELTEQIAGQLGYAVTELSEPALPGAITYSGVVSVFVGTTEYSVQAITLDTIAAPEAPAAISRSAALLAAWLPLLGVSL